MAENALREYHGHIVAPHFSEAVGFVKVELRLQCGTCTGGMDNEGPVMHLQTVLQHTLLMRRDVHAAEDEDKCNTWTDTIAAPDAT